MGLALVTGPKVEPVSLDEVKSDFLHIDHDKEDGLLTLFVSSARTHIESAVLRRALLTQTWDLYLDSFPDEDCIEVPLPPLRDVESVKYTTFLGGEPTTMNEGLYVVDSVSQPGCIVPIAGWPTFAPYPVNAVAVRFVAGYGAKATDVPAPIRNAIMVLVAHLYENREAEVGSIDSILANLLTDYRIW